MAGVEALERADRLAVVAILAVVVVLEHERVVGRRPVEQRGPALWHEHGAGWHLMRRRDERGGRAGQRIGAQPAVVDGYRHRLEAGALDHRAVLPEARLLDDNAPRPAAAQHGAEHRDRLRDAAGDDDALGLGDDAAGTPEVRGERVAQRRRALPRAVAEIDVGRGGEGAARGGQPGSPRERAAIGRLGPEVEARGRQASRRRRRRRLPRGHARDARRGAPARHEEALGDELAVGLDDHPARHAQLGGQRARRRQRRPRVQPPRAHAVAELLLELDAQRLALAAVEDDEEVAAEVVDSIHAARA
jgi:hypothetical protein